MEITTFKKDYLPDMAALFVQNFKKFRASVPVLPDLMEDPNRLIDKLAGLMDRRPGLVALDGSKIVGYLGWFLIEHFRDTDRKGAYCPEWGHAAAEEKRPAIYRALYRAAARQWVEAGCQVHALTLLAHDHQAEKTWFWSGFGLTVIDAIRPISPLGVSIPADIRVRKATLDDADALAALEAEHWRHYGQPPVLMAAYKPQDAAGLIRFLSEPPNSLWVALDSADYMGYMRFERNSEGACAVVDAPDKIACTGAFVRPQYRGRKAAPAMLDAALRDYAALGFARCSVDFESLNPEAAAFWVKYFEPVCLSVIRVPER